MSQNAEVLVVAEQKDVDLKAIGAQFRDAREAREISIADASAETHIRQLYLKAIENGNLDALPGHIYKIGFVKTYATYLKLDAAQILTEMNLIEEITPDYSSFTYAIPVDRQRRPGIKITLAAATLLFIGGVILYVSDEFAIHESEAVSEEHVALPVAEVHSVSGLDTHHSVPDLEVAPIQETTVTEASAVSQVSSLPIADFPVRIVATKNAWVQVSDDAGKAVFVRLMREGETYTVPAEGRFKLNTGNGGGVKLSIGDKLSTPVGDEGKVVRGIDLSKDSVSKVLERSDVPH
ncbi:MAG: helix-turn-helix domain-containing protein [Candidatus Paracaedibacteraceae bacterium]|nr:helix-turn-helix domain-containing protein [Candidatus Paracaedibacteraceae bacterium]